MEKKKQKMLTLLAQPIRYVFCENEFNEYSLSHKLTNLFDVYQLKRLTISNQLNVAKSQKVFQIEINSLVHQHFPIT